MVKGGPPTIGDQYGDHQKAMEVCEVCGAFLVIGDAQQVPIIRFFEVSNFTVTEVELICGGHL